MEGVAKKVLEGFDELSQKRYGERSFITGAVPFQDIVEVIIVNV